jgi:hypothetical protein
LLWTGDAQVEVEVDHVVVGVKVNRALLVAAHLLKANTIGRGGAGVMEERGQGLLREGFLYGFLELS